MPEDTRRESDAKMMRDPDSWPAYPRLPMKNYSESGNPRAGIFMASDADILNAGGVVRLTVIGAGCVQFETPDELYDAGWRID